MEFYRRPEIRQLSISERDHKQFLRKLEAISKLGELKNEFAVFTLVALLENKIFPIQRLNAEQKLLLQQEAVASLAKIGGAKALSKLKDLLNSKDPKERLVASRGYSSAAGGQAVTDLIAALKKETDTDIKIPDHICAG